MLRKQKVWFFINAAKLNIRSGPWITEQLILYHSFIFLGVILDEHLSWKEHVNMVTNTLSKISGVINWLKYVFPKQILINLYKSLFTPQLNFGSLVWGTNTKQIEILQKRLLKNITNSSYIAHAYPILKELELINVKDVFSLKILNFLHPLSHNM